MKKITVEEMDRALAAELVPDTNNPMQDVPKTRSMLAFRLAAHRMQGLEALYGAAGSMSRMVDTLAAQRDGAMAQAEDLLAQVKRLLDAIDKGGPELALERLAVIGHIVKYAREPARVPVAAAVTEVKQEGGK